MIEEDYVSYEVAKLLKDKGFDLECLSWYSTKGNLYHYADSFEMDLDGITELCSAPTLQMAMKWLREKHNVCIIPSLYDGKGGFYCFVYTNNYRSVKVLNRRCNTYESACENAIKYCLETLI